MLARLLPTAYDREQQRLDVENMRQVAEYKRDLLSLYVDVKLVLVRQQNDTMVASQATHLQQTFAAFAAQQYDQLSQTLNSLRRKFLEQMELEFQHLELYRHRPALFEPAVAAILHQIDSCFALNKNFLDGFGRGMHAKVQQQLEV